MKRIVVFLLIVFFSNNAMNNNSLQFFDKIKNLHQSDDANNQLIFNELYQKCSNADHEIWPDNLRERYWCVLSQLELIDQLGNPKRDVSQIIKELVKKVHINASTVKYILIEPSQNTLLYPSLESKKQIGSFILVNLLLNQRLVIDLARASTINSGTLW